MEKSKHSTLPLHFIALPIWNEERETSKGHIYIRTDRIHTVEPHPEIPGVCEVTINGIGVSMIALPASFLIAKIAASVHDLVENATITNPNEPQ